MTKPGYFQRAFFEEILKQFPKKVQPVEAFQELLGKGKNAIYRPIYTTSDLGDRIFSSFGSPNYLISADAEFCSYTKDWFHNSFNHSISISKHSLKNRKQFFNMLEKKVLASRKRIENIIEDMY